MIATARKNKNLYRSMIELYNLYIKKTTKYYNVGLSLMYF